MVIDHHAWCKETATASFYDVRPRLGATSTILTQYLQGADVEPPLSLVTALFYGIKNITLPPRARLGATSTLLTQYLQTADAEPPLSLATALFYGIKTITMGLSRDTSPADAAAYSYL